jgi:hypothetical protein
LRNDVPEVLPVPTVELPAKRPGGAKELFQDVRSIVIVGANGTGKTRMGAFIENAAGAKAHRLSAQRVLSVPAYVQPRAYDQAQSTLLYGHYEPNRKPEQQVAFKLGNRWGGEPYTQMLNDFEHLLALLFADEAKRNRDYSRSALKALPTAQPPKCKLDALTDIWSVVMPQRALTIFDDRIEAKTPGGGTYQARHMSDGERVAVYLMGQALCAPEGGIVIIDEPELHLHRAIQALLWDQIEAKRTDCTFVYITHDLDFAATRAGARRVWLKDYDGKDWVWDEVGTDPALPDALMLQVLGSRRPVVFVEGDNTSHDAMIYSALYTNELIVPCQSCQKVIDATKAMRGLHALHHLAVRGLVDRDRRGDEEVAALKDAGVMVADVAEIENLLCLPEALGAIAKHLKCSDGAASKAAAEASVLAELNKMIDQQALARALAEIQFRLNGFGPKIGKSDATKLEGELRHYVTGIDVGATVASCRKVFQNILMKKDYRGALRYFNCKGIVSFVANTFGIEKDVYTKLILGFVKDSPNGPVATAMRKAVEG